MNGQCSFIKASGERCRGAATGQHGLCWAHDPKNARRRRRTASRGGRAKANRELVEAKQQIKGVIAGVLSGRLGSNVGSVAFQGYRTLLSAISTELAVKEQTELIERLEALEEALKQKGERRWGA